MYTPKYFEITDKQFIYNFLHENGFATLFSQHNGEPYATQLPILFKEDEYALYGHFARPNEQWEDIHTQQVLVVFSGPHCYISPSWYETEKAVPTWNYLSAHVYGKLEIIEDSKVIIDSLQDLVNKYEGPDSSYQLKNLEPGFIEGMSKGVVVFKINITKVEAKAKLSQNHSAERRELVIKQLEKSSNQDERKIASLMKEF